MKSKRIKINLHYQQLVVLSFMLAGATISSSMAADTGLGKVLAPEKFSYPMRMGYAAAQQQPELMSKLFCYCGCDHQDHHTSLLDCYLSTHGAYCAICLEEAITAKQQKLAGASLLSIQKQVDDRFAKYYPYAKTPTPQLVKYRE